MARHIIPATPAFDAAGTPYSPEYGDIYHSADSGPGQARHVFLGGNDLPARWVNTRVFTILETGFGLGLNFLATWQAWRDDPRRPERLHFVSVEKHPFAREGLAALHARYPEFATLSSQLQAAWPLPLPGLHRLEFEDGRVMLTLAVADVVDVLPELTLAADAIYLDGFAPDRNPEMWSPAVVKAIARLARPGATLATYTTARAVRDALAPAGFAVELRPGFGRKRHLLAARFSPRGTQHCGAAAAPAWAERRAIVVGAGLAGAAVCERLAAHGWAVELVERAGAPADEASGIPAGVFHPHLSRDDSLLSRLTRSGFLYSLARWRRLEATGQQMSWSTGGVLQMAKNEREEARMAATVRALGFPPGYAEFLSRPDARGRAAAEVRRGGWWFSDSGWMDPATLVRAQLAAAARGSRFAARYGVEVHSLSRDGTLWRVLASDGSVIAAAPVMVLANSHDAARLCPAGAPLKRVRGQLTRLPAGSMPALTAVLAGTGHLIPQPDGGAILGATFDYDDEGTAPRAEDHAGNLDRLGRLLPGSASRFDPAALGGAVGFRCVAADRLPLVGALPDGEARGFPRLPGLYGAFAYGSRGLTWSALAGEIIASAVEGEPQPVERDLAAAVDPARFLLRSARRGRPVRV